VIERVLYREGLGGLDTSRDAKRGQATDEGERRRTKGHQAGAEENVTSASVRSGATGVSRGTRSRSERGRDGMPEESARGRDRDRDSDGAVILVT